MKANKINITGKIKQSFPNCIIKYMAFYYT